MINPHEANILRRLRRSDNFVFSSSSSSSSSTSGDDGKVYFTQQTSHHSNANPSFDNRFGGDDSFGGAGFAGNTFGASSAGFGGSGFVFDDFNGGAGSNYAGTSGSHYSGSGGSHYNSGSSGSGTHYNAGSSGSGQYHGNKKPTGQTVITSGVISNGKVHQKTDKINHYD
ncbi:hypothetical protein ACFFRR_007711 [Megaselia abdita]